MKSKYALEPFLCPVYTKPGTKVHFVMNGNPKSIGNQFLINKEPCLKRILSDAKKR